MRLHTGGSADPESLSAGAEAVQHPFQQGQVGMVVASLAVTGPPGRTASRVA